MQRFGKIIGVLIIIIALVLIAAHLLIRFYLTEERLKALIIPPAEEALGRPVTIGGLKAGLLTGITVDRAAIKEADGQRDFAAVERLTLRYDLLKLFQRRLAITEITVHRPEVSVIRAADGSFNYETLALLQPREPGAAAPATPKPAGKQALPLAVSVSGIRVEDARLHFRDLKKELPEVDGRAGITLALDISPDLTRLDYNGRAEITVDARHGGLAPHLEGTVEFTARRADYDLNLNIDRQDVRLHGSAVDFTTGPTVIANLESADLDLEYLAGLGAALPESQPSPGSGAPPREKPAAPPATTPAPAPATALPPKLRVSGTVDIGRARHREFAVTNFHLVYELAQGILTVGDLRGNCAGGGFGGEARVDLTIPGLAYEGKLQLTDIGIGDLLIMTGGPGGDQVTGTMGAAAAFSGRGTAGEVLRDNLDAEGGFRLTNGAIRGTPAATAVADLLGLPQLREPKFEDMDSTFLIKKGRARVKSSITGTGWRARSEGTVDLDGSLDLPVTMVLGRELSRTLQQTYSWAAELANEEGETELALALGGTLRRPKASISEAVARRTVEKTIIRQLEKALSKPEDKQEKTTGDTAPAAATKKKDGTPAEQLLKGIFGR